MSVLSIPKIFIYWSLAISGLFAAGHSLADNPKNMTDAEICRYAVDKYTEPPIWEKKSYYLRYVYEAARRNLTCGLSSRPPKRPPSVLNVTFGELSKEQRLTIQSKLAKNNYYRGKMDGLFGSGTKRALNDYNSEFDGLFKLNQRQDIIRFFDLILEADEVSAEFAQQHLEELLAIKNLASDALQVVLNNESEDGEVNEKPSTTSIIDELNQLRNNAEYGKLLVRAEQAARNGDGHAHLVLGEIHQAGTGVPQNFQNSYIWFNIAAAQNIADAVQKRNEALKLLTPEGIVVAQEISTKCSATNFSQCPYLRSADIDHVTLKSAFLGKTRQIRKQIQYSLRELGYYKSSVDGLWGPNTQKALLNYAKKSASSLTTDELLIDLASKVEMPKLTASKKEPQSDGGKVKKTSAQGYTKEQALAICEPRARLAGKNAGYDYQSRNNSVNCTQFGTNINCSEGSNTTLLGGIAEGLNMLSEAKEVQQQVMRSCMAEYGWY